MPIRLICSDIDGTLLQYGRKELEGSAHRTTRKTVALSVPGACFKGSVLGQQHQPRGLVAGKNAMGGGKYQWIAKNWNS